MNYHDPASSRKEYRLLPANQYLGDGFLFGGLSRLFERVKSRSDDRRDKQLEHFRFTQLYLMHAGKASASA